MWQVIPSFDCNKFEIADTFISLSNFSEPPLFAMHFNYYFCLMPRTFFWFDFIQIVFLLEVLVRAYI